MGRAINRIVTIVELIKRRIVGLHQIISITFTDINDIWETLEEGLLPLETTRHVSMITITLSKNELDTSALGKMDYDGIVLESWPRWVAYSVLQNPEMQMMVKLREMKP